MMGPHTSLAALQGLRATTERSGQETPRVFSSARAGPPPATDGGAGWLPPRPTAGGCVCRGGGVAIRIQRAEAFDVWKADIVVAETLETPFLCPEPRRSRARSRYAASIEPGSVHSGAGVGL